MGNYKISGCWNAFLNVIFVALSFPFTKSTAEQSLDAFRLYVLPGNSIQVLQVIYWSKEKLLQLQSSEAVTIGEAFLLEFKWPQSM